MVQCRYIMCRNYRTYAVLTKVTSRVHFDKMVTMREELTSLGHSISSDDFAVMILSSVPMSYEPTLSAMTASAKVSIQDLPLEVIMSTLLDSHDLCQTKLPK